MTRAQRRKSLAVDRSMALEPGLAKSLLAGEREEQWQEEQVAAPEQQQEAQAAKRGSSGRRKSQAASRQVRRAVWQQWEAQAAHPLALTSLMRHTMTCALPPAGSRGGGAGACGGEAARERLGGG